MFQSLQWGRQVLVRAFPAQGSILPILLSVTSGHSSTFQAPEPVPLRAQTHTHSLTHHKIFPCRIPGSGSRGSGSVITKPPSRVPQGWWWTSALSGGRKAVPGPFQGSLLLPLARRRAPPPAGQGQGGRGNHSWCALSPWPAGPVWLWNRAGCDPTMGPGRSLAWASGARRATPPRPRRGVLTYDGRRMLAGPALKGAAIQTALRGPPASPRRWLLETPINCPVGARGSRSGRGGDGRSGAGGGPVTGPGSHRRPLAARWMQEAPTSACLLLPKCALFPKIWHSKRIQG